MREGNYPIVASGLIELAGSKLCRSLTFSRRSPALIDSMSCGFSAVPNYNLAGSARFRNRPEVPPFRLIYLQAVSSSAK